MILFPLKCVVCGKKIYRSQRRINESKKFGWKVFCSLKCQGLAKNKQKILKCGNPSCSKTFKRQLKEIPASSVCFCSKSCAAIFNNSKSPKRCPKIRICPNCKKEFTGQRKYCSKVCRCQLQKINRQQIIAEIKEFYETNGRIPVKIEYHHHKAARLRFGTWNKAVKAAGFEPNPVMFAKKYIAFDGHKCDSFAEFVIDNWLNQNNIPHQVHVPYPNSLMSSDFLVDSTRIEFVGLKGEIKKYDRLLRRKMALIKKQNLRVIEIYPKDLFPKNRLDKVLRPLL